MVKLERPCSPMAMLAFPLLAILTLRGLMRLYPQQMPQHPSLISLRQMLPEPLIRRCIPRCSTRTERL